MSGFTLADLEAVVARRAAADPGESWTAKLVSAGMERAARKLGEEAVETVIAAVAAAPGKGALEKEKMALGAESADLLYHLLVVLRIAGVPLADVMRELERRTGRSGLAEKAARR